MEYTSCSGKSCLTYKRILINFGAVEISFNVYDICMIVTMRAFIVRLKNINPHRFKINIQ